MSKTFSKVMVICALVAVLPLLIAGTTLAAYYSIDSVLNVAVAFVDDVQAENEDVTQTYAQVSSSDGTSGAEFSVSAGHTQTISLRADYSAVAYTFNGWFAGSMEEYKSALATKTLEYASNEITLDVSMENDSNYVAVYEAKTFTVSWNYQADPSVDTKTTEAPDGGKTSYVYGEALPTLTNTDTFTFKGWKIDGDETLYSYALFTSENVELSAYWIEASQILLEVDNNGTKVSTAIYKTNTLTTADILDALGISTTNGYSYVLVDEGGAEVTSFCFEEDTTLTLKVTAITYTATISSTDDATYTGGSVQFTVEDYASLTNALDSSNWSTTYSFWVVEGLTNGSTTYVSEEADLDTYIGTFVEKVANGHTDLTLTPSVKKYFQYFSIGKIEFGAAETSSENIDNYIVSYDGYAVTTYNNVGQQTISITNSGSVDSTSTIATLLGINSDLYANFGSGATKVEFEYLYISYNGVNVPVKNLTLNSSVNDLIEILIKNYGTVTLSDTFTAGTGTSYALFVALAD